MDRGVQHTLGVPAGSPKRRTLSDTTASALAPSPDFHESMPVMSRDDHAIPQMSPQTPRRPAFLSRGLSLHLPPESLDLRVSASPLEPLTSYASPATSLPRHSRGLDFARACTNLHHSTLAGSSPESSPVITQKSMAIPSRKGSVSSMVLDSPNFGPSAGWPNLANMERSAISSSVGSVNMLASESGSSESDDDDLIDADDNEDVIFTTPQVHRLSNMTLQTPFKSHNSQTSGGVWSNNFSPAAASLMSNAQRSRLRKGRSRKSSSSASGHSALPSPRTTSPPPLRSIETASGYFGWPKIPSSRRESLALGTDQLHLSSSNDSGDETAPTAPSTPGVVRRAVTRRGNLLPKTKGFARIRAALLEESAPVDTESRREADTIRQVRERDTGDVDLEHRRSVTMITSSPGLLPTVPGSDAMLEDIPEDAAMGIDEGRPIPMNFGRHASRNGAGLEYWNKFEKDLHTPPPPSFPTRGSSSMSVDVNMDSPAESGVRSTSVVSAQDQFVDDAPPPPPSSQGLTRKFGKRSREDDFDIASIKRRAVSPSLSVQGSPIVSQSPRDRESIAWGQPPKTARENSSAGAAEPGRANSGASLANTITAGPKRVGLQGMTDTNDGLMKMSIE